MHSINTIVWPILFLLVVAGNSATATKQASLPRVDSRSNECSVCLKQIKTPSVDFPCHSCQLCEKCSRKHLFLEYQDTGKLKNCPLCRRPSIQPLLRAIWNNEAEEIRRAMPDVVFNEAAKEKVLKEGVKANLETFKVLLEFPVLKETIPKIEGLLKEAITYSRDNNFSVATYLVQMQLVRNAYAACGYVKGKVTETANYLWKMCGSVVPSSLQSRRLASSRSLTSSISSKKKTRK
jgi:hypothetical protein